MNTQEVKIPLSIFKPELFLNDGPDWEIDENEESDDVLPAQQHRYWYYKKEPLTVPSDLLH